MVTAVTGGRGQKSEREGGVSFLGEEGMSILPAGQLKLKKNPPAAHDPF